MKMKNLVLATAAFASIAAVADVYQAKFTVSTVVDGKKANVIVNGAYDDAANKYAFWTKSNANLGTVEFDIANEVAYRKSVAKNVQLAWGENNVLVAAGFGSAKSLSGKVAGIIGGAPAAGTWTLKKSSKTFEKLAKGAENAHGLTAKLPNLAVSADLDALQKAAKDAEEAKTAAEAAKAAAEAAAAEAEKIAAEKGAAADEAVAAKAAAEAAKADAEAKAADAEAAAKVAIDTMDDLVAALKAVESIDDLMETVNGLIEDYTTNLAHHVAWLEEHRPVAELKDQLKDLEAEAAAASNKLAAAQAELDKIDGTLVAQREDELADAIAVLEAASNAYVTATNNLPAAISAQEEVVAAASNTVAEATNTLAEAYTAMTNAQQAVVDHEANRPDPYVEGSEAFWDWSAEWVDLKKAEASAAEAYKKAEEEVKKAEDLLAKQEAILEALKKSDFDELLDAIKKAEAAVKAAEDQLAKDLDYKEKHDDTFETEEAEKALDAAQEAYDEIAVKVEELKALIEDIESDPDVKETYEKAIEEVTAARDEVADKLAKIQAIKDKLAEDIAE